MSQTVEYSFLHGDSLTYKVLPFEKLHDAPVVPGLYVWHFKYSNKVRLKGDFVSELYNASKLFAVVKGQLRLEYKGELSKTNNDVSFDAPEEFLKGALAAASLPLYIGISIDLQSRLRKHRQQFSEYLESNPVDDASLLPGFNESDTDEESSYFAGRLGKFWCDNGFKDTSCLYVKFIEFPSGTDLTIREIKSAIQRVEKMLNTMMNPVFGRR